MLHSIPHRRTPALIQIACDQTLSRRNLSDVLRSTRNEARAHQNQFPAAVADKFSGRQIRVVDSSSYNTQRTFAPS